MSLGRVGSTPTGGTMKSSKELAYIVGCAIGDGNISNPNGRAYRLRITCDLKYPKIIEEITKNLKIVFSTNKVSTIKRVDNAVDISVYNNQINDLFGWKMEKGRKINQKIKIPNWIGKKEVYIKHLIKGLFETDGSIYKDRNYLNVNLVSYNKEVTQYAFNKIRKFNFNPKQYQVKEKVNIKHILRISKDVDRFIKFFNIKKS